MDMRRLILLIVLAIATSGCMCLPNPQSEWTTSEGGEQRSTLDDATLKSLGGWYLAYLESAGRVGVCTR